MNESFGKYELLERIGHGGMAEVFLARSIGAEGLEKRLVIKKILPDLASDDRFVEMFIDEAKIAMGLNHPNIVQVYDFGKVGSGYYLAMEYVDGAELGSLLRASRQVGHMLDIGDAAHIAVEVARGLDYIHRRRDPSGRNLELVHRDISPENLMISWDGMVKIVDFGIATGTAEVEQDSSEVQGKFGYMSPEQAGGEPVDARSDLFSLGVVFFEMLCGRPLFRGESDAEIVNLVSSAVVPDVRSINPEVPRRLEHALYKLLARDPDERFATAREFQVEATHILHDLESIHDAGTVADYLELIDDELDGPAASVRSRERHRTTRAVTTTTSADSISKSVEPFASGTADGPDPSRGDVVRQEKKVVVVAGRFGDSADAGERGLDEAARADYRHIVESIAYKTDAVVDELDDRGFVVLLGIPVADETDPERAVQMGMELQEAVSGRLLGLDESLDVEIAICEGEVLLEEAVNTGGRHYDWQPREESIRRWNRLLEEADDGAIVVDADIHRRIRRSFECQPVDGASAGDTGPLYRVDAHKSGSRQIRELRRSFQSFYGREIPHRLLRDTFRQTLLGERAQALIFVGPTGVGKSTLVQEFLEGLNREDVQVVRGVTSPFDRDVPLASAKALFAEMIGVSPDSPDDEIREAFVSFVDRVLSPDDDERKWLLASISQLFAIESPEEAVGEQWSGSERRRHLFSTFRRLTNQLAAARPLVLAIDDIHHVDPVMLEFAAGYFDEPQKAPVFFVGTGRETGPHVGSRPWRALGDARYVKFEKLGALPDSEAAEMARDLLRHHGIETDGVVETLVERSRGNPLYLTELVDALANRHDADDQGPSQLAAESSEVLPPTVEGLAQARIDRLTVELRDALQRLALLPSPFPESLAEMAIDADAGPILGELVDVEMLELYSDDDAADRRYRFVNEMTREMVRDRMVAAEARQLHGQIADRLLSSREQRDQALIARHLDAVGDTQRALEYYEKAVGEAFEEFGAEQCLAICDRVLEHPELDDHRRFRILNWRHRALERVGEPAEVAQTLGELEALAPDIATPREGIEIAVRRARFHVGEGAFDEARDAVEQALAIAREADDPLGLVEAWRVEAVIELGEGDRDRALGLIDRAIASLNIEDDDRARKAMVEAYNARGVILRQSGRHLEALEAYETALAAVRKLGSTTLLRQLLMNSGLALAYVGEFSEARRRYQRALSAARRLGHRRGQAAVLVNLGHLDQILGRTERAIEVIRRGLHLGRRAECAKTMADAATTLGLSYLAKGELKTAGAHLERGLELAESIPHTYLAVCAMLGRCQLFLETGDRDSVDQAIAGAEEAKKRCIETGLLWGEAVAEGVMARAHRDLDRRDEARRHSQRAVDYLDEVELLGSDEILVTHAELLADDPEWSDERLAAIRRVVEIFESRREAIDDPDDRRVFVRRPINVEIRRLAGELDEAHPPVTM